MLADVSTSGGCGVLIGGNGLIKVWAYPSTSECK
jgi:hypothetical protein